MSISRREFAKLSFLYSLGSLISPTSVLAKTGKEVENFYLQINLFGAPSRWQYDLSLKPTNDAKVEKSDYVTTSLNIKNDIVETNYKTSNINGINFAPLWQEKLSINGQLKSQDSIYNNMLTIRGCDMAIDGHEINSRKLVNPFGVGNSLTGHMSNLSNRPYSAIQLLSKASPLSTTPGAYNSELGINPINIPYGDDYGKTILNFGKYESYLKVEDRLLDMISGKQSKNRAAVTQLLKKDLDRIYDFYKSREKVYRKIITDNTKFSSLFTNLKGYQFNRKAKDVDEDIVRASLGEYYVDGYIICQEDIKQMANGLDYSDLAKRFAITETIIKYELSSSCLMMVPPVDGVKVHNAYKVEDMHVEKGSGRIVPKKGAKPTDYKLEFTFDPHDIGLITETIMNDQFYRLFQSCLVELVDVLKKENKFDNTLIHLTSEFDRTPRMDLSGSDHGYQGHTSTLITGMIKGTYLTGNIYAQNPDEDALHYGNGTWGAGAPHKELQGRKMSYRNIISTISYMLGIKSITPSDMSLISIKNDKSLNLLLGDSKNV
jgi:hypothetical protein